MPFISGILLIMNVHMISSAKALHEWIGIKQVVKPKAKPFIVSIWYRPPDNKADIMRDFQLLIEGIETLGLEVNILGDVNCYNVVAYPLQFVTFTNSTSLPRSRFWACRIKNHVPQFRVTDANTL